MRENKEIYKTSGSITFVIRIILCVWICYLYLDVMTIQKSQRKKKQNLIFHWHVVVKIDPLFKWMLHIVSSSCICTHYSQIQILYYTHTTYIQFHFRSISILYLFLFAKIFFSGHFSLLCIYSISLSCSLCESLTTTNKFETNLVSVTAVIILRDSVFALFFGDFD